jgi:hypothetical protein
MVKFIAKPSMEQSQESHRGRGVNTWKRGDRAVGFLFIWVHAKGHGELAGD